MISSIRRRPRLFGIVMLLSVLVAGVIAVVRPQNYTSYAEIVVDPTSPSPDAEATLAHARAWLRSDEAARAVAGIVAPWAANRLIESGPGWSPFGLRLKSSSGMPFDARGPVLVRRLRTQASVKRVADSYAFEIGFTASDPRLAATVADAFAAAAVAQLRRVDPAAATLRVVSTADPDVSEQGPVTWTIFAAGALAGVVAGATAVAIAERRFTGLTSGADVQSKLSLYHLGSVPLLRSVLPHATSPVDAVVDSPFSGYAESFRSILVASRLAAPRDAKVFLITSALPDEGKSTTVACLARSAALAGERVAIVDCDSRRRGASVALVNDRLTPGLADLLRGGCSIDDALVQDTRSDAWIIPISDKGTEISFLGGEALAKVLETLRDRFDLVLVDSPPMLAMAITRSILPLVDASIMVAHWRATPDRAVKTALSMVPDGYSGWSGVILTQVDMAEQARYGLNDASAFYQQSSKYYRQ